ncbi:MAG: flavodoxin family protein [Caulobacter sp.]|nr:flavodoxin family protein [Caulobacter sp.]
MRHAIILAHPKPTSFCASVARRCVQTLRALGYTASLRDLYRMDFDPRLQAGEIPGARNYGPAPDVARERARLAGVDSFILVYPFWFNAPPAILKGYVDRVLSMGFGYRPGVGGTEPLLQGRSLTSFSTSGAPEAWVVDTGAFGALTTLFDNHLAAVTGLTVRGHTHLGAVRPNLGPDVAHDLLDQVERALRDTFGGPADRAGGAP